MLKSRPSGFANELACLLGHRCVPGATFEGAAATIESEARRREVVVRSFILSRRLTEIEVEVNRVETLTAKKREDI